MQGTANRIARNSIFSLGATIALKVLSFAYTVAIVRQLGDTQYGQYATVMAFVGILALLGDFGMANYSMREIAKDHALAPLHFWNMVVLRLILGVTVLGANILLAQALGYDSQTVGWIALASAGLFFYAIQGPLTVVLNGFERSDIDSYIGVVQQVVLITTGALFLWLDMGVPGVIIASFISVLAGAAMMWRAVRRLTPLPWNMDPRLWRGLLVAGAPFVVINFAGTIAFRADTIMLSLWRPIEEAGWYNVAYNLILALLLFSDSFMRVLTPSLARHNQQSPEGVRRFHLYALRTMWIITIPIAVGTTAVAPQLVTLIYGEEFANAGLALQILIWTMPVVTISSLSGVVSTVYMQERSNARISVLSAIFNVSLNVWAIPTYGLIGAAVTTVATEFASVVQYSLLLRKEFPLRTVIRIPVRPLLASLLMGAAVELALYQGLPLLACIAVGVLVYPASLILIGGLKIAEIRTIATRVFSLINRRRTATAGS